MSQLFLLIIIELKEVQDLKCLAFMKTYICSFETSLLNNFDNLFDANLVNIF